MATDPMNQARRQIIALALSASVLTGCGSAGEQRGQGNANPAPSSVTASTPQPHPQAVEPTAGVAAASGGAGGGSGAAIVGDVNAHAPPLAEVKRELQRLNLCGGVTERGERGARRGGEGPGLHS